MRKSRRTTKITEKSRWLWISDYFTAPINITISVLAYTSATFVSYDPQHNADIQVKHVLVFNVADVGMNTYCIWSRLLPRLRNLQRHRAVLPAIARLFLFYRLLRHIGFLLAPSSAAAGETLHLSSDGNNTSPVHVQIKLLPSRTGVSDERIQCNLLHLLLTCTSRRSLSRYRTYSVSP